MKIEYLYVGKCDECGGKHETAGGIGIPEKEEYTLQCPKKDCKGTVRFSEVREYSDTGELLGEKIA